MAGGGGDGGLLLLVLIWGANFAIVKRALDAFAPLAFNSLRFLLASAFVFAALHFRGALRMPRGDWLPLLGLGILGNVVYQLLFVLGIDLTRAGNASLILALIPIITATLSVAVGHERLSPLVWVGAVGSVVGVVLVSGEALRLEGDPRGLLGDLLMLAAAFGWAGYTVGSRQLIVRHGSLTVTAWTMWLGSLVLVPIGIPSLLRQDWQAVDPVAWGGLVYSACLSIGLAYLLWYRQVERIGNTRTSVYVNMAPLVALTVAAVWLGERLTPLAVLGAACTIGGVLLVRLRGLVSNRLEQR